MALPPVWTCFDFDSFRRFCLHFDAYALCGGQRHFLSLIGEEPMLFVGDINDYSHLSLPLLRCEISRMLCPSSTVFVLAALTSLRMQFSLYVDGPGLSRYIAEYDEVLQHAPECSNLTTAIVNAFICGLQPSCLQLRVGQHLPVTFDAAARCARSETLLLQVEILDSAHFEIQSALEVSTPSAHPLEYHQQVVNHPVTVVDDLAPFLCSQDSNFSCTEFSTSCSSEAGGAPCHTPLQLPLTQFDVADRVMYSFESSDPVSVDSSLLPIVEACADLKIIFSGRKKTFELRRSPPQLQVHVLKITIHIWNFFDALFRVSNFLMMTHWCNLNIFLVVHPSLFDLIEKKGKG